MAYGLKACSCHPLTCIMHLYTKFDVSSGIASGWRGWTMSRGPEAKEAPRERERT